MSYKTVDSRESNE